ncbi:hypothetical protein NS277_15505 [Novosphingobium barchaimii]|nr:hypothetical protein NS277_15505 [Novosphingobium barchaimii]
MRNLTKRMAISGLGTALAISLAVPAVAVPAMTNAEKLYRLDMMLRVTGAQCSATTSDFRQDYAAFWQAHRSDLGWASNTVWSRLAQRYGNANVGRAFDRVSYGISSEFGSGHPWLGCADLKAVTHGLALVQGTGTLVEVADQILPSRHIPRRTDAVY